MSTLQKRLNTNQAEYIDNTILKAKEAGIEISRSDLADIALDILMKFDVIDYYTQRITSEKQRQETLDMIITTTIEKVIVEDRDYHLDVPTELDYYTLPIQSITGLALPALRVNMLRLSEEEKKYKLRVEGFKMSDGLKLYMPDTSILKAGGTAFFSSLRRGLAELVEKFGKDLIFDINSERSLEGLARSSDAVLNWLSFIKECTDSGINIAVMGQTSIPMISILLNAGVFSGQFNQNQAVGQIASKYKETSDSGIKNFLNNFAGNFSVSAEQIIKHLLKDEHIPKPKKKKKAKTTKK